MKLWKPVFITLIFCFASFYIIVSCGPPGPNGKNGPNGFNGMVVFPFNRNDDDAGSGDDTGTLPSDDDTVTTDDDGGDDDSLTKDDLPYADQCPTLADCVVKNCQGTPDPDSYALLKCTLLSCKDDYASCFGAYGQGACVQILKCLEACLPADCQQECMAPASYDSLLQFADVGICVENNCPTALEDPLGNIGCFIGVCNAPVATCCGGSILGCM